MPWEAKRWFWFAGLMFVGSLWALTYSSDDVQRRSIIDTEMEDKPTIPLRGSGPEGDRPTPPGGAAPAGPETDETRSAIGEMGPAPKGSSAPGKRTADKQPDAGTATP